MIKMFKQKKRGQLSLGQDIRIQLNSDDMVTFFKDKETEKTIKDYEYLLNEKQFTLDGYVQYLDTVCELAKIDKVQIIEIVKNNKKRESVTNLLDELVKIYLFSISCLSSSSSFCFYHIHHRDRICHIFLHHISFFHVHHTMLLLSSSKPLHCLDLL